MPGVFGQEKTLSHETKGMEQTFFILLVSA